MRSAISSSRCCGHRSLRMIWRRCRRRQGKEEEEEVLQQSRVVGFFQQELKSSIEQLVALVGQALNVESPRTVD